MNYLRPLQKLAAWRRINGSDRSGVLAERQRRNQGGGVGSMIRNTSTGLEAPGQLRLLSRKMQRTTADGCTLTDSSSELEEIISLQAVIGVKPEKTASPIVISLIVVILPMN